MAEYRRQHYVAQSLLRRFTRDGKHLWVFDKLVTDSSRRIHQSNVRKIAQESRFFDISLDVIKPESRGEHDPKMIEKMLGRFDAELASEIPNIIDSAGRVRLDSRVRGRVARALGIQALRTRDMRDAIEDIYKQGAEAVMRALVEKNFPGQGDLTPSAEWNPALRPVRHARAILEIGVKEVGRLLFDHTWTVGVNTTAHPLYISDNPVVRFAHFEHPTRSLEGYGSPGIEVAFPLDPAHILIMRDRRAPGGDPRRDGTIEPLDVGRVDFYNRMQVEQCRRQVYCSADAFTLPAKMCDANPELCTLSGSKVHFSISDTDDPLRSRLTMDFYATRRNQQ